MFARDVTATLAARAAGATTEQPATILCSNSGATPRSESGSATARLVSVALAGLLLFALPPQSNAACPQCGPADKQDPVLPAGTELVHVPMLWCAMADAPSIDDPDLVCEDNFKDVLWRRHERASECVWIPQARLTMRSGAAAPKPNYDKLNDQNTSAGEPGDVIFSSSGFPPIEPEIEINDLLFKCDQNWSAQPKGILTLAIGAFVGESGNPSSVRGYGTTGATRPVILIVDPQFIPSGVDKEHVLAHEAGHVFGLCHVDEATCGFTGNTASNLMLSNGSANATELVASQCNDARAGAPAGRPAYSHGLQDPSSAVTDFLSELTLVDYALDGFDISGPGAADLYKVLVVDEAQLGRDLSFVVGTNGLLDNLNAAYWVGFDVDNDVTTGRTVEGFIPEGQQTGVELVARASTNLLGQVTSFDLFRAGPADFEPLNLPVDEFAAEAMTANINVYTDDQCLTEPFFAEIHFVLKRTAFDDAGLPGNNQRLFPDGLALQAVSRVSAPDGEDFFDLCPDEAAKLDFPVIVFPEVSLDVGSPCPGETVTIHVTGLSPNKSIKVLIGEERIMPGVMTDGSGSATFEITIPENLLPGPTLLTVGVTDVNDAITGDIVVDICESTAVELSSFELTAADGLVMIAWSTRSEENHLGFNLLRAREGEVPPVFVAVNPSLISGSSNGHGRYEFVDRSVEPGSTYEYYLEAIDRSGTRERFYLGAVAVLRVLPKQLLLHDPTPNPFNPSTMIGFDLPQTAHVTLTIYDIAGRAVRTVVDGVVERGYHEIAWNGRDAGGRAVGSGIYVYRLRVGNRTLSTKAVLAR